MTKAKMPKLPRVLKKNAELGKNTLNAHLCHLNFIGYCKKGNVKMTKAKPLDRLELTRQKMALRDMIKGSGHGIMTEVTKDNVKAWQEYFSDTPAYPGAEEHQEEKFDGVHCPYCGAEMRHEAGCLICPNRCFSKCG